MKKRSSPLLHLFIGLLAGLSSESALGLADDPFEGAWTNVQGEVGDLDVSIHKGDGEYRMTWSMMIPADVDGKWARGSQIQVLRLRMEREQLVPKAQSFVLAWYEDGLVESSEDPAMLAIAVNVESGNRLRVLHQDWNIDLRRSDPVKAPKEPPLGTWGKKLGDENQGHAEITIVRSDGAFRVLEVREVEVKGERAEAPAVEKNELRVDSLMRHTATWQGAYLELATTEFLFDGRLVDIAREAELVSTTGFGGPAFLMFSGTRALLVRPNGTPAYVDFGERVTAISDGSYAGEWRGSGSLDGTDGQAYSFDIEVRIDAVLGDLYTAQIVYDAAPTEPSASALRSRTEAFCRGTADGDRSLQLVGASSSVKRGDSEPKQATGWSGSATLADGKIRLTVGPGDRRDTFVLTRTR